MSGPQDRSLLPIEGVQWLKRELSENAGGEEYLDSELPSDLKLKRERIFESLLRQMCVDYELNYETTLRYLLTRIRQDSVIRSQVRAMEWAETQYQTLFGSTCSDYGDLVSMGVGPEGNPDQRSITVKVVSSPELDLEWEARQAARSYEDTWKLKPDIAVGVRTDETGSTILETKEVPS